MEKKIENTRYLEEFIEFCQSDLTHPSSIEKEKWINTLTTLIYPYFIVRNASEPTDKDWLDVLSVQKELLDFLNWITDHLEKEGELHFMAPSTFAWAGRNRPESVFLHRPSTARWFLDNKITMRYISVSGKPEPKSISLPWGVMNFFEALKGFPISSLLRCPHCGKVFFNSTKRKKIYCSSLCQNTAGVQRLRIKRKK